MVINSTLRSKPHLQVLLGWTGNEPQSLRTLAAPATGEAIMSGMVIVQNAAEAWVKADDATATSPVSFAWDDQDQPDVRAGGKLQGLSSLGAFKLQTGFFDSEESYEVGTPLTVCAAGPLSGYVCPRTAATQPIVGYVTKVPFSLGARVTATTYTPPQDNSATDLTVLEFMTKWESPSA